MTRDAGFDVVVSGLVLKLLPDPEQAVRSGVMGVILCVLAVGCRSDCDTEPCVRVDRDPIAGDFVVDLDTETAFVVFEIDGRRSDQGLVGGQFVFTSAYPACTASSSSPCTIMLERLRLELSSAMLPTSEGDVELDHPVVSIRAPLELVDSGFGYLLAAKQTDAQTCVTVDGTRDSASVALDDAASVNIDIQNETFSLDGRFPLRFRAGADECQTFDGVATVTVSGRTPWAESP